MPILKQRKSHLQALGLPSDAETIRRARAFLHRSGLTSAEFADMAMLNASSLRVFLTGHYDKHYAHETNTLEIRAALKQVMDRYDLSTKNALTGTHHPSAEHDQIRASMIAAALDGKAVLVDGPPGTGKSWTFLRVAQEINRTKTARAIYVYCMDGMSPQSFLIEACIEAGIPTRGTISQLVRKLGFFLSGERSLLIVDEAQHLDVHALEILRQLLDTPPYFGVVLGGSHNLSVRLRDWRMEQWRSRLRRTHLLQGLSKAEATHILTAELGPMHPQDIADTILDATVEAVRDRVPFKYISARNLFFAIGDARAAIAATKEAIA